MISCPECKKLLQADAGLAGWASCDSCGTLFYVSNEANGSARAREAHNDQLKGVFCRMFFVRGFLLGGLAHAYLYSPFADFSWWWFLVSGVAGSIIMLALYVVVQHLPEPKHDRPFKLRRFGRWFLGLFCCVLLLAVAYVFWEWIETGMEYWHHLVFALVFSFGMALYVAYLAIFLAGYYVFCRLSPAKLVAVEATRHTP